MSIFEDKQKMGLISSEFKNRHNVKTNCVCFSAVISGLKQEEKYMVYEDNYYRLQEYKNLEKELGIDLLTLIKANNDGAYFKEDLRYYIANIDLKHKCVRLVKHYEAEDDFDCHYVMFKEYGKTWALTKEELE